MVRPFKKALTNPPPNMDIRKFKPTTPGRIVAIDGGERAYVPDTLPPKWKFPERLWPLLVEARGNLMLLEGLGRHLRDPGILFQPLQGREAIQSSALEGTYATPRELLLFELEQKQPTQEGDPAYAWKEVFNYQLALRFGTTTDLPLSLRLIRKLHGILMDGVRGDEHTPGEFRQLQVAIGVSRRFVPPPPQHLTDCLDTFEKYLHAPNDYDPLVDCFLAHYQFEAIHPFRDGNGRVGRLLLAIMIQQRCKLTHPWLYLSNFFAKNREEYVQRLFQISASNAWGEWIEFCLRGTVEQAEATIDCCDQLRSLRDDYRQRIAGVGGNVRLNQIIEGLFRTPMVRVMDVPARLDVTYPTAKSDLERLVEAGILSELSDAPVITFYAPEIMRIVYADIE
jgi:Fic family protein